MQRSTMSCNSVCRRRRKLSSHVRGERGRSSFSMVTVKTVVTRAILTVKTEVEAVMARLAHATPSACDL